MSIKKTLCSIFAVLLLIFTTGVFAENELPEIAKRHYQTNEGYTIYYNAVSTSILSPEVARSYNVTRSKNRFLLTVSVRKGDNNDPTNTQSVFAEVIAQAINLTGQLKKFEMRRIEESNTESNSKAIYYVDDFRVDHEETLQFTLKVIPENQGDGYEIKFKQQFFVD